MTERLYYHDSFTREFDAQVLSCEREGDRWGVILDRTAFYPTSGGQPYDTGTLAEAEVLEVKDVSGQQIVHYTSSAVPLGQTRGKIDWARRLDHMQQHTGQHLLSAAFLELFQMPTVSFHLGREVSTIDLEAALIMPRHVEEAERRTNEIIFEDRLVSVRFGTAEELEQAGIRKKVDREGILRAIEVEGFDRQPCGGTHLARTGQAGLILLRKLERRRDSWRLEFACGYRALAATRGDYAALTESSSLLSCGAQDVPSVLGKVLEERRLLHASAKKLEARLVTHEAHSLLAAHVGKRPDECRVILAPFDDATVDYLRLLAATLVAKGNVVALLGSRSAGHVAFAQTKGASADMGRLLRQVLKDFQGKGGGGKDFAQGTLKEPTQVNAFLAHVMELLSV